MMRGENQMTIPGRKPFKQSRTSTNPAYLLALSLQLHPVHTDIIRSWASNPPQQQLQWNYKRDLIVSLTQISLKLSQMIL